MTSYDAMSSSESSLPDHVQEFILSNIQNFITWDLVRFFHDNPHARDTAENIARHISRDVVSVLNELLNMSQTSLLDKEVVSGHEVFSLSADQQVRIRIGRFIEACHDRNLRRLAIHQVFEGMLLS